MENLNNIKKDVLFTLANKYKFYDQDINIIDIEIDFRNMHVSIRWEYEYDSELRGLRNNTFKFIEVWKKDNK